MLISILSLNKNQFWHDLILVIRHQIKTNFSLLLYFKEWCQVVQTQHLDLGELQRQTVAAVQAKTMVSLLPLVKSG